MEYVTVKNLEKYHPGYKDRTLQWAKIYFKLVQGDPEFEMVIDEVDKWRFVTFVLLELYNKKPTPISEPYLIRKGFDLKKRKIESTIKALSDFIKVSVTDSLQSGNVTLQKVYVDKEKEEDKDKDKEKEEDKEKNKTPVIPLNKSFEFLESWKSFLEMRKSIKSAPTEKARSLLLKKLESFSSDESTQIKIINQSTMNSYKGFFELKEAGYGKNRQDCPKNHAKYANISRTVIDNRK